MKKTVMLLFMTIVFIGCKPQQAVTNTKLDHKAQVEIKGEWTLVSVKYPGSEYIKVTSFDIADSKCFVGSSWKFISNDNKGTMALNNSSCTSFSSPITWYVNKDGNFVMKITNGTKSKKVVEGYILTVSNQTETSFELIDKVNVGGQMTAVVYEFQKN
ncbi:lipocalin family protein [Flavobacterium sp. SUN046]|uniref:lipocalin family protein n=1 Tax=Flavobacterium sp. SUN046 TaxID=3002440 RepID=UPI002DBCDA0A|nr:lipocalin family protein [Flavobacterium sp. SUN046]MEC4049809.1 lipocalin family protein [Flavobacterium sp. SUN046]